jgi:DNA repair protein RadC
LDFKVRKKELTGSNVKEMLDSLSTDNQKGWLVREICVRYGETRLQRGDTFTNSSQIHEHFGKRLGNAFQEMFFTLVLDNKHRIISEQLISIGTINRSIVHPREVFVTAIEQRAAAIILVHNHPSGDPKPSSQDIEITKRLVEVGNIVGIKAIDHVIIGQNTFFSFVDEDLMP